MYSAEFTDTDFRGAQGYQFDDNLLSRVILSPNASDQWSTLRRSYTGGRFGINLMFLVLFFLPIVMKAMFWMQVAHFESFIGHVEITLAKAADALAALPDQTMQSLGEKIRKIAARGSCLTGHCERVWLPAILLGVPLPFRASTWLGYVFLGVIAAAGSLLILYNGVRGVLTYLVLPLRDEEERSGHTPRRLWNDNRGSPGSRSPRPATSSRIVKTWRHVLGFFEKLRSRYGWMVPFHWVVQILQYLAYGLRPCTL
jgi:hypothetical protein